MTRAENSRLEPAGNHPLALTFQNASAFASASVPAQLPPRLRPRLRPRPDSLGSTPPHFREEPEVPPPGGAGAGRSARAGARLPGARAEGGAAASPQLGSCCGGSAGSGARAATGGGDGGPAAWVRAARSFRPAPAPGRGRVSGGPASGAWAPQAGAGTAGPAGPVIRGEERPPPPPPRPADFSSPALPLPAQPRVASAAEAKGSSAQDSLSLSKDCGSVSGCQSSPCQGSGSAWC